jgi:hypothetical protein
MICTKCKEDKGDEHFYRGKKHNGRRCKKCRRLENVAWLNKLSSKRAYVSYVHSKKRAEKKHLDFDLSIEFLENLLRIQNDCCALSKIPFSDAAPFVASLDRIDNSKGYLRENVRYILYALNTAISNHGLETYLQIADAVKSNLSK